MYCYNVLFGWCLGVPPVAIKYSEIQHQVDVIGRAARDVVIDKLWYVGVRQALCRGMGAARGIHCLRTLACPRYPGVVS